VSSFSLHEAPSPAKDFQLKAILEKAYRDFQAAAVRMPKKERFYFREKSERLMLEILEDTYRYSYDTNARVETATRLSINVLVFREFLRLAFDAEMGIPAGTYLSIGRDLLSALKILKALKAAK
jgi:hypothetical protein